MQHWAQLHFEKNLGQLDKTTSASVRGNLADGPRLGGCQELLLSRKRERERERCFGWSSMHPVRMQRANHVTTRIMGAQALLDLHHRRNSDNTKRGCLEKHLRWTSIVGMQQVASFCSWETDQTSPPNCNV